MNPDRSQKKETNGTPLNKSFFDEKKYRRYKIVAAILAIFVLHFAWQFSFVQKENLRVAEDSLKNAQTDISSLGNQANESNTKVETEAATQKTASKETSKKAIPAKFSPPENRSSQPASKNKTSRESNSERLRRAEKLLTGF